MRRGFLVSIIAVMVMVMMAIPVGAQGPEPGTVPSEALGALHPSGGCGRCASAVGEDIKAPGAAPELSAGDVNSRPGLSSHSEAISDADLANHNTIYIYSWTNLLRDQRTVSSQGWSSATHRADYMRSGNYLCRNGSCGAWHYYGGNRIRWVWAGWSWDSDDSEWYSRSYHYFRFGSTTRTIYTDLEVYF